MMMIYQLSRFLLRLLRRDDDAAYASRAISSPCHAAAFDVQDAYARHAFIMPRDSFALLLAVACRHMPAAPIYDYVTRLLRAP